MKTHWIWAAVVFAGACAASLALHAEPASAAARTFDLGDPAYRTCELLTYDAMQAARVGMADKRQRGTLEQWVKGDSEGEAMVAAMYDDATGSTDYAAFAARRFQACLHKSHVELPTGPTSDADCLSRLDIQHVARAFRQQGRGVDWVREGTPGWWATRSTSVLPAGLVDQLVQMTFREREPLDDLLLRGYIFESCRFPDLYGGWLSLHPDVNAGIVRLRTGDDATRRVAMPAPMPAPVATPPLDLDDPSVRACEAEAFQAQRLGYGAERLKQGRDDLLPLVRGDAEAEAMLDALLAARAGVDWRDHSTFAMQRLSDCMARAHLPVSRSEARSFSIAWLDVVFQAEDRRDHHLSLTAAQEQLHFKGEGGRLSSNGFGDSIVTMVYRSRDAQDELRVRRYIFEGLAWSDAHNAWMARHPDEQEAIRRLIGEKD